MRINRYTNRPINTKKTNEYIKRRIDTNMHTNRYKWLTVTDSDMPNIYTRDQQIHKINRYRYAI